MATKKTTPTPATPADLAADTATGVLSIARGKIVDDYDGDRGFVGVVISENEETGYVEIAMLQTTVVHRDRLKLDEQ